MRGGQGAKALKVLTALPKRQPRDARIYLYTGLALKSLGKTDEAKDFFKVTEKLAPEGSKLQGLAKQYLEGLP